MRLTRLAFAAAAAIPLALLAFGCASTDGGAAWTGRNVRDAISRFGPPTRVSNLAGGDTVFTWERLHRWPKASWAVASGGQPYVQTSETVTATEFTAWVRADGTIWSWSVWDTPTVVAPVPPLDPHAP